jgi:aspartyl-tRNA(Asn)/glutamyl-tRNA(Gln) amidotransferase subunit B
LRESSEHEFGEKVEIKNLNSFKAVKTAIEFEIKRQERLLNNGEKIIQETRLWDADKNETFSMRSKEEAHDYRYFPDPDLPPIRIEESFIDKIKALLPELPAQKKERFITDYSLPDYDAGILTSTKQLAEYFESAVRSGANEKKISNWILSELLAHVTDTEKMDSCPVKPSQLAKLIELIDDNIISGKIAKTVFSTMLETGKDPDDIVEEKELKQVTDLSSIEKLVDEVIRNNQQSVEDYKSGKEKALKFLVGQIMKESRGKANPQIVNEILIKKLS